MGADMFNSAFCSSILKFFSRIYGRGIIDACQCGDESECTELVEKLKFPAYFATLKHPNLDWMEWQFINVQWTKDDRCRTHILKMLMSIRSPKHNIAFVLQLTKMFYRRGILDYLECREWLTSDIVGFLPKYPYLLKTKKEFRLSKRVERFEALQYETLSLMTIQNSLDFQLIDKDYRIPKMRLLSFTERIWSLMQSKEWYDDYD